MTKAIEWYPEESGAMQPTSRPNKKGEVVFCCFCQAGIFVTNFGYGQDKPELSIKKSVWKCSGCKQTLNKHHLILDLIRWRIFNGHSKNYTGHINPYKEQVFKTLERKPKRTKSKQRTIQDYH